MKKVTITDFKNNQVELDISEVVGLHIGNKVRHNNAGKYAGSDGIIPNYVGEILDLNYEGQNWYGGHVFTAKVKWEDGETYTLVTNLLTLEEISK